MTWLLLAAVALYWLYEKGWLGTVIDNASQTTGSLPFGSTESSTIDTSSLVPFTTSSGQSGMLGSDGTIYDDSGNVIGVQSSSGARPGQAAGDPDFFDDGGDP